MSTHFVHMVRFTTISDLLVKRKGQNLDILSFTFYDDDPALEHRYQKCRADCAQKDKEVIDRLVGILRGNPYSEHLRTLGQIEHVEDYHLGSIFRSEDT